MRACIACIASLRWAGVLYVRSFWLLSFSSLGLSVTLERVAEGMQIPERRLSRELKPSFKFRQSSVVTPNPFVVMSAERCADADGYENAFFFSFGELIFFLEFP